MYAAVAHLGMPHCIKTGGQTPSAIYEPERGTAFLPPWLSLDHL
jgi:hypothetical protein